jgi:hypothetical protein
LGRGTALFQKEKNSFFKNNARENFLKKVFLPRPLSKTFNKNIRAFFQKLSIKNICEKRFYSRKKSYRANSPPWEGIKGVGRNVERRIMAVYNY